MAQNLNITTIYEYDCLVASQIGDNTGEFKVVPAHVFDWLEKQCLLLSANGDSSWAKLTLLRGRKAVQFKNYVGVIRTPDGFQIEILPKIGKMKQDSNEEVRKLLIEMLRCLNGFRHIKTDSAKLSATTMPLIEVFIREFLISVEHIIKRGLRSDYISKEGNLFALRGKLSISTHLRQNILRADRFYVQFDEYITDRAENRLLHSALRRVLSISSSQANQKLARELKFVFSEIPESNNYLQDFSRVRLDRGMEYYSNALAWSRLILEEESPLIKAGINNVPSLLFPMEAVFEAYVAKHLAKQLDKQYYLNSQVQSHYLVRHLEQNWFKMKPDLIIKDRLQNKAVLDTKWKLLDSNKSNRSDKYDLSQSDFYQLHAYSHAYLDENHDAVLIYPKTDSFSESLPVFKFPTGVGRRLWVVPFCLKTKTLLIPNDEQLQKMFL